MAFNRKMGQALREVIESKGEDGAIEVIRMALESKKMRPEDFSIREIWEACNPGVDVQEAVASSSFPKITGELINAKVIAAYEGAAGIAEELVETIPSNMQVETFAGMTEAEFPEEVGEGQEYNDSTIAEKYVTAHNKKYGRRIDVTEEMIYFDKTGQVLSRANRIGVKARQYKEKLIIEGVQDINSNVYRPSGTPTAFYASGNGNLITSNPFGESGLENVMKYAQIQKDDSESAQAGDYIYIDLNNVIVLVPVDLQVEAWQLANSAKTPESAENAENYFKGRFKPLTSPYITAQSSSTWYWGNFREDFKWVEVWPLQTLTAAPGNLDEFKRDIKAMVKVRMFGSIAALDYRHCYKSTS